MASLEREIRQIKEKYGPRVARAFRDAMREVVDQVTLARVVDALDAGDIESALDALNLDEAALSPLRQVLSEAFSESGQALVALTSFSPPRQTRAVVRWNVGNPRAVQALNEWLGEKITQLTEDSRAAVRNALSAGFAQGQGPRQIALDVVGRVGANGRRTGGVIGLSQQQERWVSNMRQYLREGDINRVLRMSRRDRRFDRTLRRLLANGETPTEAQIQRWTGRYADRLLKLRGDTISRTETASAVEQGRFEGFRQGVESQGYPLQYAIKEWRHGGGGMTPRVQHVREDETVVRGLETPFVMPDGTQLQYPHDPDAPPQHVVNCTCSLLIGMDWVGLRRDGWIV